MLQALRFVTRGAGAKVDAAIRKNISTVLLGMLGHDEVLCQPAAKDPCTRQSYLKSEFTSRIIFQKNFWGKLHMREWKETYMKRVVVGYCSLNCTWPVKSILLEPCSVFS